MDKLPFVTGHNFFARRLAVGLLALIFLLVSVGCSGQILLPDGSIVNADGSVATGRTDPEQDMTSAPLAGTTPVGDSESETPNDPADAPLPFLGDPHTLYAEFLDTGKSDCIIIRMDEQVILLDTGDADDYDLIADKLTAAGIDTIDHMILSHMDNDHIGSADRILQNFAVKTVYMPDYVRQSQCYRDLIAALSGVADRTEVCRLQGQEICLDLFYGQLVVNASGLYDRGQVVNSDNDATLPTDENNFSLITSVNFGSISLFLPGDAERARMEEFNQHDQGRYTLIKTPHHGGYDMGLAAFLDRAQPDYAVISTNHVDTIDPKLSNKLLVLDINTYTTCNGTILFATNGTDVQIQQ